MKPAILLVDLQNDFLSAEGLEPAAGLVVESAARLLESCRRRAIPVIHIWTTVHRQPDDRMPHWKAGDQWRCVEGTPGHETPANLRPVSGEFVVHKQFFSGFGGDGRLDSHLRSLNCDALLLAGVHLHGCVRATALDAYERGYAVWIADDAVASDDPLHAAITRRYLAHRAARFAAVSDLLNLLDSASDGRSSPTSVLSHCSPTNSSTLLWQAPIDGKEAVSRAATAARRALPAWRRCDPRERAKSLGKWAERLTAESESLADQIVWDVGKPITMARAEIRRGVEILRVVAVLADQPMEVATSATARYRHEPLGVVGIITPYNNPVAIPLGKIGPALLYGNTVVWKPAPAATMISRRVLELGLAAGWPEGLVRLCTGNHSTAACLADNADIDGLTVSGGSRAGYALQELCARRHIPFQAELGGNNAAIVCEDAALPVAASLIAEGAFGFAGQRCTANRRAIVVSACFEAFLQAIQQATNKLVWGDPNSDKTVIGPLISAAKRDEVRALLDRAAAAGLTMYVPHRGQADYSQLLDRGAFYPPTIVVAGDPASEIVQEETFGPVLVIQRATDFDDAIRLCNGVRQGLIAAIFTESPAIRERFLAEARAGVLKINRATADADAVSPLDGWKASGVGPAEHGPCDREFDCRIQTIYDG
jgi:alpha-ketoglutaric semialdehyde dehydrogenase